MYQYRCKILKVIDGDTVDAEVDLGFDISAKMRFRLSGINAPEMRTPEGKAAREWLVREMPAEEEFLVETLKDRKEKYGRYLGSFYLKLGQPSINQKMVQAGHAVRAEY